MPDASKLDRPGQLRILHVSEVHWGGVVTLLDHFMDQQRLAGHDVHLLAPPGPQAWVGGGHHRWDLVRKDPRSLVPAVRQLRNAVSQLKPDVVHLHSFFAGQLGRLPVGLSWRGRVPVVYQPHAWSTDLFRQRSLSRGVKAAERLASRRTHLLVANCQDEIDHGARLGVQGPGRVLGVAVDLEKFRPDRADPERQRLREELGLGPERLLLVLGRIAYQKGQDLLLPEWERSRPKDALLALVGPGSSDSLARLAPTQWNQTVRVFDAVDDVRPWLRAADLLLLPSRYETVGLALAEAMATGLPVVATEVDGARSTVQGGDLPPAGEVVPVADMRSLLQAADRRLEDFGLWKEESAAARARAEDMFRPESVAGRLEAAYREAINTCRVRNRTP